MTFIRQLGSAVNFWVLSHSAAETAMSKRERECGRARANERQRRESMSIVSESSQVGFFWRLAFPEWAKVKAFCDGGLSACVCMCVHVCACLCLGLARRCCFLCPLAFVGAAELPTPCSVQLFSWRTASCALCSVLSYRPTDHRVMT